VVHFLDTNVLLYSVSSDPAEARKRERARDLLEQDEGALSLQVLQEFYVQATRASRPNKLQHDIAVGLIRTWMRFRVQATTVPVVSAALEIKAASNLSYWDSAIVASAQALGCAVLYSEDMHHGQVIGGVTITNPFR